jgi:hypothetical protein
MNGFDKTDERRTEPRFPVNERALAFLGKKYGKIIDINSKGLSFQYIVKENRPLLTNHFQKKHFTLDISSATHDFCLTDVPVKIISEDEVKPTSKIHPTLREIRYGVQFKNLSADQLYQIKNFILSSSKIKTER